VKEGIERWEFETGGKIYGSPLLGPDGTVYIGSDDHRLYAVKPPAAPFPGLPAESGLRDSSEVEDGNEWFIIDDIRLAKRTIQ